MSTLVLPDPWRILRPIQYGMGQFWPKRGMHMNESDISRQHLLDGSTDPLSLVNTANAGSTSNSGSYTFSSQSIGAAPTGDERRYVVVCQGGREGDGFGAPVTSISIAGTNGTLYTGGTSHIAYREVSSGTTATIIVTYDTSSGTPTGCAIAVYTLRTNGEIAVVDNKSQENSGTSWSTSINVEADGAIIAAYSGDSAGNPTWANGWTQGQSYDVASGDTMESGAGTTSSTGTWGGTATGMSGSKWDMLAVSFR